MAPTFRKLSGWDAALMPEGDSAVAKIVGVEMSSAGALAGSQHRLVSGSLRDPLEDLTFGRAGLPEGKPRRSLASGR
jgi:hypothetical protein